MFFVRTAGKWDLEAISILLSQTWHDTYDRIYGPQKVSEITSEWHSPDALDAQLGRPDSEFIVADDGQRIGGVAYAALADQGKKTVMLHQLYVSPDFQGQGIGTDLLQEVAGAFPDAITLRVEIEPANEKAIGFYEARGFAPAGEATSGEIPTALYELRLVQIQAP